MRKDGHVTPEHFPLLGTQYRGNGQTTFALPNVRYVAPRSANGPPLAYIICVAGVFPGQF